MQQKQAQFTDKSLPAHHAFLTRQVLACRLSSSELRNFLTGSTLLSPSGAFPSLLCFQLCLIYLVAS